MITRLWHGWTTPENADAYETLLETTVFPGILSRNVAGFRRIELLRLDGADETNFVTLMWFDDMAAVRRFAGDDPATAVVPPAARALLARFDPESVHFTLRAARVPLDQASSSASQ
ncbi:MAG: antibiotic biosynthesis monooxygenase family protein [Pseudooceanicola sp.]